MRYIPLPGLIIALALLVACGESDGPSLLGQSSPSPSPDILPRAGNLVGYWKMENNWNDSSGQGNHGAAASGTPSFSTNAKVGSYAGSFDGSSNVSVPDSPSLGVTTSFTIMTWIYVAGPSGLSSWLFSKNAPGFASGYGIAFAGPTGQVWPHLGISGGLQNPASTGTVTFGQWNLVTVTYDGSQIVIYINDALDSTLAVAGSISPNNSPLYIGNSPGSPTELLNGLIDNLAIWDVALTLAEIQDVYTRQYH